MALLIIEEDVRLQHRQHLALLDAAEKEGLVGIDTPVAQRGHHPLVRRRIARRDDRDPQPARVATIGQRPLVLDRLDVPQLAQELSQRSRADRDRRVAAFVLVELVEAGALEHRFRLIIGQHAVEIEGDAQFLVAVLIDERRVHHLPRRVTGGVGGTHVRLVGGQEQADLQRIDVRMRRASLQEHRAADAQTVGGDRIHDPQAGVGIVLRQQDHLDQRIARSQAVQRQQPLDERKRHAGRQHAVAMLALVLAVDLLAGFAEHLVGFAQVEQRAGREPDHQSGREVIRHRLSGRAAAITRGS